MMPETNKPAPTNMSTSQIEQAVPRIEWPTLGLLLGCYSAWALGPGPLWSLAWPLGLVVTVLAITLFSSLQHEVLHGHPFRHRRLNEALVFPAITIFVPYGRFRDQHLEHHRDEHLTDPYDDPEANYLDPKVWARLSRPRQVILRVNNTLAGRIVLGPAVSILAFVPTDWRAIRAGDRQAAWGWGLHLPGLALVVGWLLVVGAMPLWVYVLAAYMAFGVLKIRTFLEHRAHEKARGRSVVVEGQGFLSLLFLNNSFHAVHHCHPKAPWYRLPGLYAERRAQVLSRNDNYVYRSYGEIFRRYLFRAKDPVPHPLRPVDAV